jgi:hypothetical protein
MYLVFDHIYAYVKLFVVWLVIVFSQIFSYDMLSILCQCTVRIYVSEILYVCYACMYVYVT